MTRLSGTPGAGAVLMAMARPRSSLPKRGGRGVARDLLVHLEGEFLRGVVALLLQQLVARGDLDQEGEVSARGHRQRQKRSRSIEDRVRLAIEPQPVVLLRRVPALELDDELDRLGGAHGGDAEEVLDVDDPD